MSSKQKKNIIRIVITALLFMALLILSHTVFDDLMMANTGAGTAVCLAAYGLVYLIIAYDILFKALTNIRHGQIFDENLLMIVATFGAFGVGEYSEALAVMLFYQIGEWFQDYAVNKSRKSISDLMSIVPDYANVLVNGELQKVDPDDVESGSLIVVKPGERIPLDGVVVEGESMVDTSALTGEPVPRSVRPGEELISGCVNGSGMLKVRTTKAFEDSTVSRILELVENASDKKAKTENFITRFARYYTPFVTVSAAVLAIIPPLLIGGDWSDWIQRACVFLVISCPCALVISVPLGFFGGIGASSRVGVLVKGSNYLEAVADMTTLVFDKTGTLTKGEFAVSQINPSAMTEDGEPAMTEEDLLEIAAHAEGYSTHPIAESIRQAYGKVPDMSRIGEAEEIAGRGICIKVDDKKVLIGNAGLMEDFGIKYTEAAAMGTAVYIALEEAFAGSILISDTIKDGVEDAIRQAKIAGVKRCVMLTGDRRETAEAVAAKLGIDEVRAELLPADKVTAVEEILDSESTREKTGFVGDGINDAPVLTRADIGFAMGSMGSDAAIEAADLVIMDDDLAKVPVVVRIARKTLRIVKANIAFALAVKAIVLVLGAMGIANMWAAVFADVGVAVICILNAMRTLREK